TGGASAVYGADAVAGVVNFVLNTHFQGVRFDAGYDFYQHHNSNSVASVVSGAGYPLPSGNVNTGFGKNASMLVGSNFADSKGNATFFATFDKQAAVLQAKFDYSACNLQARSNGTLRCGGSGTSARNGAGGYFQAYSSTGTALFTNTVDGTTGQFLPFDAAIDRYNFGPTNFYRTPNTRWTGGTFVNYDGNIYYSAFSSIGHALNVIPGSYAQLQRAVGRPCVPRYVCVATFVSTAEMQYLSFTLRIQAGLTGHIASASLTGALGKYNL